MGKHLKLHIDSNMCLELNPEPWSCEAAAVSFIQYTKNTAFLNSALEIIQRDDQVVMKNASGTFT